MKSRETLFKNSGIYETKDTYPLGDGRSGKIVVQATQVVLKREEGAAIVAPTKNATFILDDLKNAEWIVELPDDSIVRMSNKEFKDSFEPFKGAKGMPYWMPTAMSEQALEQGAKYS
jgi:hypothetical protein